MRVGVLTHAWPRYDGDVAGAFLERLALALVARGHELEIVTPADQGRGGGELRNGIPVTWVRYAPAGSETLAHRGTMLSALRSPAGLLWFGSLLVRQARAIAQLHARRPFDVVHAHWWVPGGVSARLTGRPYIVTLHGMDVVLLESSAAARAIARPVLRRAAALTAVSSDLADRIAHAAGVERSRIAVQPMPIVTSGFTRTSKGGGGVVTVGRLQPRKRLDLLLRALAQLKAGGRALPLTIVGDGPERQRLEALATELDLRAHTRFVGAVPPERIAEAVGDADVFAFPALGEGFGLAAAEALMLGIPVVAARDGGGVRDFVPEQGPGRLIEANVDALARALVELADDPAARRQAAEVGAALRQRLEPATAAQHFEELYRQVAAQRGGAAHA